jgi:hypothetical protein
LTPVDNPPKIISEPTIHPLPLPLSIPRRSILTPRTSTARALGIASTLLSLQSPTSYPPNRGQTPRLEVAQGGQVCVVLDVVKGRKRSNFSHAQAQESSPSGAGAGAGTGKAEWVIVLEFEAVVQEGSDRAYQKVSFSSFGPSPISSPGLVMSGTILTNRSYYHFPNAYTRSFDFKLPHPLPAKPSHWKSV